MPSLLGQYLRETKRLQLRLSVANQDVRPEPGGHMIQLATWTRIPSPRRGIRGC